MAEVPRPLHENALAHVPKAQHRMAAAAIRTASMHVDQVTASVVGRQVADQLRARPPKPAALMDEAEADVIAFMAYPKSHPPKLHSTNPVERLNKEVKRRADVVGTFPPLATPPSCAWRGPWPAPPNEASIRRLVGAIPPEQNDEWQLQHRSMTLETMAGRGDEPSTALLKAA